MNSYPRRNPRELPLKIRNVRHTCTNKSKNITNKNETHILVTFGSEGKRGRGSNRAIKNVRTEYTKGENIFRSGWKWTSQERSQTGAEYARFC